MAKLPNWGRFLLELEINGVVVTSRISCYSMFDKYKQDLQKLGEAQDYPWFIFLSKTYEHMEEGVGHKINSEITNTL
jgi:hypothetical protein